MTLDPVEQRDWTETVRHIRLFRCDLHVVDHPWGPLLTVEITNQGKQWGWGRDDYRHRGQLVGRLQENNVEDPWRKRDTGKVRISLVTTGWQKSEPHPPPRRSIERGNRSERVWYHLTEKLFNGLNSHGREKTTLSLTQWGGHKGLSSGVNKRRTMNGVSPSQSK